MQRLVDAGTGTPFPFENAMAGETMPPAVVVLKQVHPDTEMTWTAHQMMNVLAQCFRKFMREVVALSDDGRVRVTESMVCNLAKRTLCGDLANDAFSDARKAG